MTGTSASATAAARSFRTIARFAVLLTLGASACSRVASPLASTPPANSELAESASTSPTSTTTLAITTLPTTTVPATTVSTAESAATSEASGDAPSEDSSTEAPEDPSPAASTGPAGELSIRVINSFPHDAGSYTQGLAFHNGELFESSGLYGESFVHVYVPGSEVESRSVALDPALFGGGIAIVGDDLVQLTWREGQALVRSAEDLLDITTLGYAGEGWGLCYDGTHLAMSDGSDAIVFREPTTFETVRAVAVTRDGSPVTAINELECVNGSIWANVWLTTEILRIDPTTGEVLAWVDASALLPPGLAPDEVLNGIAYSAVDDTFYVTIKHWGEMYQVVFE